MPSLDVERTYEANEIFIEIDLDNVIDSLESFFNSTRLDDFNFLDAGITASSKFKAITITGGKLAVGSIITAAIINDSIDKTKINSDIAGIGLIQALDGALEASVDDATVEIDTDALQLKDIGLATIKIIDQAVTHAKLGEENDGLSTGISGTSSLTANDTQFATSDISLTNDDSSAVLLFVNPRKAGTNQKVLYTNTTSTGSHEITVRRDGAILVRLQPQGALGSLFPFGLFLDSPPIDGANSFDLRTGTASGSGGTMNVTDMQVVAVELRT